MEDKKAWQFGYDIDVLKAIESDFAPYNKYCLSPFSKMKKNNVAEYLHNKSLGYIAAPIPTWLKIDIVKVRSKIVAYHDTLIGYKEKGDIVFSFVMGDKEKLHQAMNAYMHMNCWLFVWAEDEGMNRFAKDNSFRYLFGKITTFGEIYSIYFRDAVGNALIEERREFPEINPAERVNIKKLCNVSSGVIKDIGEKLKKIGPEFANHYSNYNIKKSWSAISLRGYDIDPSFIIKPEEMNDKWWEEYDEHDFFLQNTPLWNEFPDVQFILNQMFSGEIHRARFMKLAPGGGELDRHTDLVDPHCGNTVGRLARIHYPIITNDKVVFQSWNYDGRLHEVNMKEGECWLLDTRKPHRVVNGGTTERIHLVVDTVVDESLYRRIVGE